MIFDYTFYLIIISCTILSLASGFIGLLAVLQKESLIGDTISHAALPGIVLAFLIFQEKSIIILLIGAFFSGLLAITLIYTIKKYTRLAFDGILALILSSFFGLGMVLLTMAQKNPLAAQAGLKDFIFGQVTSITYNDAIMIMMVSLFIFIVFIIFFKEIKLYIFDANFAYILGFNTRFIQLIIATLLIVTIITQLQTIGVILTSSMLIAPGVAALQWFQKFKQVLYLSAIFGAFSSICGTIISAIYSQIPTGPAIVVIMTLIAFFSIIFGKRGLVNRKISQNKIIRNKVKI